jgi:predicted phosphate transport protein (TIGR00153 family)
MVRLIPKDISFFAMFAEICNNLISGARVLVDLFDHYQAIGEKTAEIEKIEHVGDELTHSILTKLNQTFITPFDREDILRLASSLDDVLDFIHSAGDRITLYKITNPPPAAGQLAKLILLQSEELGRAVSHLRKNGEDVLARCIEIKRCENEADRVSREEIGRLFEREKDPLSLIKIKELLEVLETATDKAEDAANVLETVVLKNA